MSSIELGEVVLALLADGQPLWATEILDAIRERHSANNDPTDDSIKATVWKLVERRELSLTSDGKIRAAHGSTATPPALSR